MLVNPSLLSLSLSLSLSLCLSLSFQYKFWNRLSPKPAEHFRLGKIFLNEKNTQKKPPTICSVNIKQTQTVVKYNRKMKTSYYTDP